MMAMVWTFFDYVDNSGSNQIETWIASLPIGARGPVRAELAAILVIAAPEDFLGPPSFESLQGVGMFEIKLKLKNIQYRILAWYGPARKNVTLLAGARKKNDRYSPRTVFEMAERRRSEILSGIGRIAPTCLLRGSN
jgi:hypothetical protein